jgi:DNA-binding LacI/PurR family transcriptional regulator
MTVSTETTIGGKNFKAPRQACRPKYLELAEQIQAQVESGLRQPGEQLPSFARMQAEHNLSQSTLEKMYQVLERQKVIVREPGRGVYIAPQQRTQTGMIGLWANHAPESHPYYSHLLAGMREVARRESIEVLLLDDFSSVIQEKVDGAVICFGYMKPLLHLLPPGLPRVAILHPAGTSPFVGIDDYEAMREAVNHLMELGHRRIGYLSVASGKGSDSLSHRRLTAYRDMLRTQGITAEAKWVRPLQGPYEQVKKFAATGRERMRRWLDEDWSELGLTALLVQNDDAAVGVIEALQDAGIKVPEEVSVVGFDGTEVAEYFRPRLTTVQVPLHEIGKRGAETLLDLMKHPQSEAAASTCLLAPLKIGDSTGPAPGR